VTIKRGPLENLEVKIVKKISYNLL